MKHISDENYDNETLTERYESINEIMNQNRVGTRCYEFWINQ